MGRIRRAGSGAFCVAALALSIAAVAHAQQAQPGSAPLTEAQTAGVKHLKEVIEVLSTGDHATIWAYVEANSVHTVAYTPPDQKTFPCPGPLGGRVQARGQIFPTANQVGHTGSGPGTAARAQFDRTTGLTAIVLSNNAGPSDAIARRILATCPVP